MFRLHNKVKKNHEHDEERNRYKKASRPTWSSDVRQTWSGGSVGSALTEEGGAGPEEGASCVVLSAHLRQWRGGRSGCTLRAWRSARHCTWVSSYLPQVVPEPHPVEGI